MNALAELERLGLKARIAGGRLQVGPLAQITPEARGLITRLAAALRAELSPDTLTDPKPRYRAWLMLRTDGRSAGIVMDPAGMTEAKALAAVDRWTGLTVQPLAASQLD